MSSLKKLRKILVIVVVVLGLLLLPRLFYVLYSLAAWRFLETKDAIVSGVLLGLIVVFGVDIAIISCVLEDSKLW